MEEPLSRINSNPDADVRSVIKSLLSEGFSIDEIVDAITDELKSKEISDQDIDEVIKELLRINQHFDKVVKREVI